VISIARLKSNLVNGWVAFDEHGEPVDFEIPTTVGPAVFLVAPVTDAVKRVEADVVESLDRDQMWAVAAIVLSHEVLWRLEEREMTTEDLLAAVGDLGYDWAVSPTSSL
jgi:hypothetical protein